MINRQSAVIDRIVDNTTAVLFLGDEQTEFFCPVNALPKGSREGIWLLVYIEDGRLIRAELDLEKTEKMKNRIRTKLELLRQRMPPRR